MVGVPWLHESSSLAIVVAGLGIVLGAHILERIVQMLHRLLHCYDLLHLVERCSTVGELLNVVLPAGKPLSSVGQAFLDRATIVLLRQSSQQRFESGWEASAPD